MIVFFCPILEHFCPLFIQIAQMGLILPRCGLILPRIPPPTCVFYSAVTNPFWGYVRTKNIPSQTPKHPFSWPEFESGQNDELLSGQNGPHLGKMFERWAKTKCSSNNTYIFCESYLSRAHWDSEILTALLVLWSYPRWLGRGWSDYMELPASITE